LVGACVPRHSARGIANCLVRSQCVKLLVYGAGRHNIDGCGRGEERRVVPGECDEVADFVVLSSGYECWLDHGNSSRR